MISILGLAFFLLYCKMLHGFGLREAVCFPVTDICLSYWLEESFLNGAVISRFLVNISIFLHCIMSGRFSSWQLTTFFALLSSGASACVEMKMFEEAITWCDKGIAVSFEGIFDFKLD